MQKEHRTLTVMEGRPENSAIIAGFSAAAKRRGWDFCHLLGINPDKIARLDFSGLPLDYVVFRELTKNNYNETERVMEWLHKNHKIGINLRVAGRRVSTSDKHFQQGLFMMDPFLKEYALPTIEAKSKSNILSYIKAGKIKYPFVLKPRRGTTGDDITLISQEADLEKNKSFYDMLIERYIKPECDWRVFVIGGVAVGTMRKTGDKSHPDNFKAWCAGREKSIEKDPEVLEVLSEIATRAAAVSGLEYAGIDIIKEADTGKLYILETNIAAGWSNFIPVTHISVPDIVIDWLDERGDVKSTSVDSSVRTYIDNRKHLLPQHIRDSYDAILTGEPYAAEPYREVFRKYDNKYLYDAGHIFSDLCSVYQDVTENSSPASNYGNLINEIESMPLSWAGNFIGPEVGTLHDGAILSALYLFCKSKI